VPKSSGGDPLAIGFQARAAGIETVFVKSSDGVTPWAQFNPTLIAALRGQGLRVCAWQFVYGNDPLGEAAQGAQAVATGADCLVIDAETSYEGKYAQAQQYVTALRTAIGPGYPLGLTSFPYVDFHPRLPYSVFLGPGAAQANLPQVYWKAIGGTVDAVSAKTLAHNRLYGAPIAPLGQTYQSPAPADLQRFRQVWASYGSARCPIRGGPRSTRARRATRSSGSRSTSCRSRRRCRSTGRSARRRSRHWRRSSSRAGSRRPARPTRRRGRPCSRSP
jgi:hypothetical protein